MTPDRLYSYFRSSAAYRVRIALSLKHITAAQVPIHLLKDGGEQLGTSYRQVNPLGLVPAYRHENELFTQSLAIIEYLDGIYPEPPLLPAAPVQRAHVRAFALTIACDIHPLNNLRVIKELRSVFDATDNQLSSWNQRWIGDGFAALEVQVQNLANNGPFCFGDAPSLADVCLVPQMANARRHNCDLTKFPRLVAIEEHCRALRAFIDAAPENQPDFQQTS